MFDGDAFAMGRDAWGRAGALGGLAALAALGTACGDGPICPPDVLAVITSPAEGAEIGPADDVSDEPGIQLDVQARSNLGEGETIELIVRDAADAVATFSAVLDEEGKATFRGVTIPSGEVRLEAQASSSACGVGTDRVDIAGTSEAACGLEIMEGPIPNEIYDPLPVLSATNDTDPSLPGFQATIGIETKAGYDVELRVLDVESGDEASAGNEIASTAGSARFNLTLGQGPQALRALCRSRRGSTSAVSATHTVYVDTEPPACELTNPPEGQAVIPELDEDGGAAGTQITLVGTADGDDVAPSSAVFEVGAQAHQGAPIKGGESSAFATFGSPGTIDVSFSATDFAGNLCEAARPVEYVTEGCSITHETPVDFVTEDANGSLPGLQADLAVQVDPACEGRTVTTTCDVTGEQSTQAVADDLTEMEITVCEDDACEGSYNCETRVVSDAGITTLAPATIDVDTQPPGVALDFLDPKDLSCDDVVDDSVDVDPEGGGVEIDVLVVAPSASERHVIVTGENDEFVGEANSTGDARIPLFEGENEIVAVAADVHGNEAQSAACTIVLADLVVAFDPPVSERILGLDDGDVVAGELELDICGTVSASGANVQVSIDDGAAEAAVVSGNQWCLEDARLSEGEHDIVASAEANGEVGDRSISVVVDITPPDAPADLVFASPDRASAEASWTAPADDNGSRVEKYLVKLHTESLDETNFNDDGVSLDAPSPSAAGQTESIEIDELLAGTQYFIAIAAVDAAGNRSDLVTTPADQPLVPDFDRSDLIRPLLASNGDTKNLGFSAAHGDFDGDGHPDLVIGAPSEDNDLDDDESDSFGNAYVYLGGEGGVADTPDFVIPGEITFGLLGYKVAALDWNGDGTDDLVVSAPFRDSNHGLVYVFFGGDRFDPAGSSSPQEILENDADVLIEADGGDAFYSGGFLGSGIAVADFDGDGRDDLILGSFFANGGEGGVTILFGGSQPEGDLVLSTNPNVTNATGYVLESPGNSMFGTFIHNLGSTRSANGRDDIAVGSYEHDALYVWRGRGEQPSSGLESLALSTSADLTIVDPPVELLFGERMASIPALGTGRTRDIVIASVEDGSGIVRVIDGGATGEVSLTGGSLVATIEAESGVDRFGADVANNTMASIAPDINGDGAEDLVIVGGDGADFGMYVWYGGIESGTTTSASADHFIPSPSGFTNGPTEQGGFTRIRAMWAGDLTGNGLEDLYWSDESRAGADGGFEVLFDEP